MRSVVAIASMLMATAFIDPALCEPVPIATNGQWMTVADVASQVKVCSVQAHVSGGLFALSGATDHPGVLRLSLTKPTWQIPGANVPVAVAFSDLTRFELAGTGSDVTISADIPAPDVRSFIHHFTADESATVTFPLGHEPPWQLDLHGTTSAISAIAQCVDATQVLLPPPFRPPATEAQMGLALAPPSTQATTAPSAQSPEQPVAGAESCKDDWRKCRDNGDLVNEFNQYYKVKSACETEAEKQAKYGTPVWPSFWSGGAFTRYRMGTDYVSTGIAIAIEPNAQFQNAFGAMVHSTVICAYDLARQRVVSLDIMAHE